MEPTLLADPFTEVIFLILLAAAVGYALLYRSDPTGLVSIIKCANDRNLTDQLFRENSRVVQQTLTALSSIGAIIIGAFVSWSAFRFGLIENLDAITPLFGTLIVALLMGFRFTMLNGIALVFRKQQVIDHVLYMFWIIIACLGPLLLLVTLLAVYGPHGLQPTFVWIGIGLIGISYMMFLVRTLLLSSQEKGVGLLNLIYYLCALEIMPVLAAYRTILI